MAVTCASRFAVLKIEDDEVIDNVAVNNLKNKDPQVTKKITKSGGSSDTKAKPKKRKKNAAEIAELQSLAFGTTNSTTSKGKKSGSQGSNVPKNANPKQWEEWKKKDNEFVSEAYEQDLQQALLLSKIDYEEKKDVYDAIQKESHDTSKHNNQSHKKKKKSSQKKEKSSMSLDEFQNLLPEQIESGNYNKEKADSLDDFSVTEKIPLNETDFFNKIEEDAEKIITMEQRLESYKKREPVMNHVRQLQFQEELQKKDDEIRLLNEEVSRLKDELKTVKSRNKKLCGLLGSGEMREKAEILAEIEQLMEVKDELTEQINEYHTALEQERSKVHSLEMEIKKYQNSRKDRRDSK